MVSNLLTLLKVDFLRLIITSILRLLEQISIPIPKLKRWKPINPSFLVLLSGREPFAVFLLDDENGQVCFVELCELPLKDFDNLVTFFVTDFETIVIRLREVDGELLGLLMVVLGHPAQLRDLHVPFDLVFMNVVDLVL